LPASDERDRRARLGRGLTRGILVVVAATTAAIFVAVDSGSHSVSDTFYGMLAPEATVVVAALVALVVVRRTRIRGAAGVEPH
jgi:hypothetical protein